MSVRYGLKEVANVIFFDIATNKPAVFFDTLKVSTIENESESAEARGGQGNGRLMSWDYGRTATLNMQDALLSDTTLVMLSGNSVKKTGVKVVGREVLTVTGTATRRVSLKETPLSNSVTVYKFVNGVMTEEITTFTVSAKDVTITTGVTEGDSVVVFYEYTVANGASRVVGDTIVRGEYGIDRKMQFVIPRAKLQSAFSLTMDAENVSTFDFNLDVMVESGTGKLYDIVRLG